MTSGPPDHARPHGRAGHEHDPDDVDKDVDRPPGVEREGEYAGSDVVDGAPDETREGDYTDTDVPDDDPDTPPGSYVRSDTG